MGYGIYGFAQGLQSGMGMGMQLKNMQWQNDERKIIKQKAEDTKLALSDFFGSSFGQTMMTGGNLSAQDKTMYMTALQGATAEARGVMGAVHDAWQRGDKETYNREMDRLNILLEYYGGNNKFDVANMEAAFDGLEQTFTHPDAINAAKAGRDLVDSRKQPMDTERLDVAVTAFGPKSKAATVEANKLLGTDYKVEELTEEQGKIVYKAASTLNNAAALGKSSFTAVLNQMKLDSQYKEAGIDLDSITYDSWTTEPKKPKEPVGMREVEYSINAIKSAESPEEAQTLANAMIEDRGNLGALGIEGTDVGQYWGENQTYLLDNISRDLATLVNEKGFVRPEEQTERNLFGVKQTMSNAEWFQILAGEYEPLWEKLEGLGVDMTNIPKIKKLKDIAKIEKLTLKGGTKKGDWRPDGWWF